MTDARFRLVVMGDSYVGKSAIVKRFLRGTFDINYVATVEDLYSQDFEIGTACLKVDILDTAGDAQFPAMRRYAFNFIELRLCKYFESFVFLKKNCEKTTFSNISFHFQLSLTCCTKDSITLLRPSITFPQRNRILI